MAESRKNGYSPFTTRASGVFAEVNKPHMTRWSLKLRLWNLTGETAPFRLFGRAQAQVVLVRALLQDGGPTATASTFVPTSVRACAVRLTDRRSGLFCFWSAVTLRAVRFFSCNKQKRDYKESRVTKSHDGCRVQHRGGKGTSFSTVSCGAEPTASK